MYGGRAGPGRPGKRLRAERLGPADGLWTPLREASRPAICDEVLRADLLHRVARISSDGSENVRIPLP